MKIKNFAFISFAPNQFKLLWVVFFEIDPNKGRLKKVISLKALEFPPDSDFSMVNNL